MAPGPRLHRTIEKANILSNEVQSSDLEPSKQDEWLSEWEEEDEILLSHLRVRLRNEGRPEFGTESNEEFRGSDLRHPEQDRDLSDWEEEDEISLSQLRERSRDEVRLAVESELPLKKRLRGAQNPESQIEIWR